MGKIMLFGSADVFGVPQEIINSIEEYSKAGWEFMLADNKGADASFNKVLSLIGARKNSKVYSMGKSTNNTYELEERQFNTYYDAEKKKVTVTDSSNNDHVEMEIEDVEKEMDIAGNRAYYEFIDKKMISECDFAICLWDGESKAEFKCIQRLGIQDKPCYTTVMK